MDPIKISFGGYQGPNSVHTLAGYHLGRSLQDRLDKMVEFELVESVLDQGHLAGDLPGMVAGGIYSLTHISSVRFSAIAPELKAFELPFIIEDRNAAYRAFDGELGDRIGAKVEAEGVFKVLGFWDNGIRHISNRVRPIRTPADCVGLRIRTQKSEMYGELFRALGCEPVATDIKDFIEQIAGDRFDGQENPLTSIYIFDIHKHHRYITLTGHLFGASLLLCNADQYRNWPDEVRAAMDAAALTATTEQRRLAAAADAEVLAKLDPARNEVIELTEDERRAFIEAVAPLSEKYRAEIDPAVLAFFDG